STPHEPQLMALPARGKDGCSAGPIEAHTDLAYPCGAKKNGARGKLLVAGAIGKRSSCVSLGGRLARAWKEPRPNCAESCHSLLVRLVTKEEAVQRGEPHWEKKTTGSASAVERWWLPQDMRGKDVTPRDCEDALWAYQRRAPRSRSPPRER